MIELGLRKQQLRKLEQTYKAINHSFGLSPFNLFTLPFYGAPQRKQFELLHHFSLDYLGNLIYRSFAYLISNEEQLRSNIFFPGGLRMKTLIFCAAFSLIVINPVFAIDPNNPLTVNYDAYEARIKKLEDKIIELENRIAELESQRPALPTRSPDITSSTRNDPDKDSLRIERCSKAVQESQNLIALYETQLKNLPSCYHLPLPDVNESKNPPHYYYYHYYYSAIHYHFMSLDSELNWALDNIELLVDIEREYKAIKNYAQRNPELNIDRDDISTRLIELRSEWGGFNKVRIDLEKSMGKGYTFMRSRCYDSISKRPVRATGVNN